MRVTEIDVAPGVDDTDHRFATEIGRIEAALPQPSAVSKRAQVIHTEPAMAAQLFRTLTVAHTCGCTGPLIDRQVGRADHFFPFRGLVGNEFAESFSRTGNRRAAQFLELGD